MKIPRPSLPLDGGASFEPPPPPDPYAPFELGYDDEVAPQPPPPK